MMRIEDKVRVRVSGVFVLQVPSNALRIFGRYYCPYTTTVLGTAVAPRIPGVTPGMVTHPQHVGCTFQPGVIRLSIR